MTNQIPLKQILPSNIDTEPKYDTIEYINQKCSQNPLFPSTTLTGPYIQNNKIK